MAAALRSSVGPALRRAASPAPSRLLSSAGRNTPANTSSVRTMHCNGSRRSLFNAEAYSRGTVPAKPDQDKADGFFAAAAAAAAAFGTFVFAALMDGEYFGWCQEKNAAARQPRMSGRRRR